MDHFFTGQMRDILPSSSSLELLAIGYSFTEGPVWDRSKSLLYFTDFPNNRIYTWGEPGCVALYREGSGRAVGLALDNKGRLLACETIPRRISRTEADGTVTGLANLYRGARINNTNDVVAKSDGAIYFTDPYSTLLMDTRELDFNGVFRLEPDSGALTLLVDDFARPNGLAFSPDEKLLYINDTARMHIRVFDVLADGRIGNGQVFATVDKTYGEGVPDGMKVDTRGNVYVTGPGGIWVFHAGGTVLGIIGVPEKVGNFCFGDANNKSLLSSSLYRIRLGFSGYV